MSQYQPGPIAALAIAAMRENPQRIIWTSAELAPFVERDAHFLATLLRGCVKHGVVHRTNPGRGRVKRVFWSLNPIDPKNLPAHAMHDAMPLGRQAVSQDDCRIPRVVSGWAPPRMIAPRAGSEYTSLRRPVC